MAQGNDKVQEPKVPQSCYSVMIDGCFSHQVDMCKRCRGQQSWQNQLYQKLHMKNQDRPFSESVLLTRVEI